MSLKARSLLFWILVLYMRIYAPVRTKFAKSILRQPACLNTQLCGFMEGGGALSAITRKSMK